MTRTISVAEAARIMCRFDVLDWKERDAFQMQLADDCKDEFAPFVRMMGFGPTLFEKRYCWMLNTTIKSDAEYDVIFHKIQCKNRRLLKTHSPWHGDEQIAVKAYKTAEQAWQAFFEVVLA